MKTIMFISRLFAGLVFVFSGFVKAVDPMGSAIKFEEYMLAFHLDFFALTSLPLAIALSAAELMIGLNLLTGIRMRLTAWLLMTFMSFFTLLTFVLALTNPVSDCGCFGDALKLTNWQTFWKNVILFLPTLVVFFQRRNYRPFGTPLSEWSLALVNFLAGVLLSAYGIRHQPLLDFRPYTVGTSIREKMIIPEGAPIDQFETILVYEKDGIRQEFKETDFPWQDTTWKWVETRQNLIAKGYEPPIHDFSITDETGFDITEDVLSDSNYTFLIIAPVLHKASGKGIGRMNELALRAMELGFRVHCLTSSTEAQIEQFKMDRQPAFPVCTSDETTLKTIIRANPGLLVLREGVILAKWNHRDVPDAAAFKANFTAFVLENQHRSGERNRLLLVLLAGFIFYGVAGLLKASNRIS